MAPVPNGSKEGSPFGPSSPALAPYLRFLHAISAVRLRRLFEHLFGLAITEGALDAKVRLAKPAFDDATATRSGADVYTAIHNTLCACLQIIPG